MRDPTPIVDADLVLIESTYGDRLHRPHEVTWIEIRDVLREASRSRGNILIPAFAIGRSQELLYLLAKNYQEWNVAGWQIFLDSPLAIQATEVYARHAELYDPEATDLWLRHRQRSLLPNLHFSRTPNQSMALNSVRSGAIIIAGSGMCTGGRIRHHLKHNVWRRACHVIIAGFQTRGTTGRALIDGAKYIRLWGEVIRVAAQVHTIGGISAHADQDGLCRWYASFNSRPPVVLVHGEPAAIHSLAKRLFREFSIIVRIPQLGQKMGFNG